MTVCESGKQFLTVLNLLFKFYVNAKLIGDLSSRLNTRPIHAVAATQDSSLQGHIISMNITGPADFLTRFLWLCKFSASVKQQGLNFFENFWF